jgi:DnaJ-class molecular chaperone
LKSNPFNELGIVDNSSITDAKAAYRRLAMIHHPDRGGNMATFQKIKAAFESIEAGFRIPVNSSFTESSFSKSSTKDDTPKSNTAKDPRAGKAAPGFEAKGPRRMPGTRINGKYISVQLQATEKQAFEGCVIPFIHLGKILEFTLRPGTMDYDSIVIFVQDEMIGARKNPVSIHVNLYIVNDPTKAGSNSSNEKTNVHDQPGVFEIIVKICAIGLFTGGQITVKDHLGETVYITIPSGYNPSEPFIIPNRGYGLKDRGNLRVIVQPVFKVPTDLTANELKQLNRLTEMTKI